MLQAVTACSGGMLLCHEINSRRLPKLSRAVDEGDTFRLCVQVLSASIPGLADPGFLTRERPRLEVVLGGVRKQTEFGDLKNAGGSTARSSSSASFGRMETSFGRMEAELNGCVEGDASAFRWRFGDTITFTASLADVLGPGLQLWLRTESDIRFGPIQVNLAQVRDIGMCNVDLRRLVLPACALRSHQDNVENQIPDHWDTPMLMFSLTHVIGSGSDVQALGQAAGCVALVFGIDTDPNRLLRAADEATRPLVDRVAAPLKQWIQKPVRWVAAATTAAGCHDCIKAAKNHAEDFSSGVGIAINSPDVLSPDMAPDGWVSHAGPNGRRFWHHLSLGPPPWEQHADASSAPMVCDQLSASAPALLTPHAPSEKAVPLNVLTAVQEETKAQFPAEEHSETPVITCNGAIRTNEATPRESMSSRNCNMEATTCPDTLLVGKTNEKIQYFYRLPATRASVPAHASFNTYETAQVVPMLPCSNVCKRYNPPVVLSARPAPVPVFMPTQIKVA